MFGCCGVFLPVEAYSYPVSHRTIMIIVYAPLHCGSLNPFGILVIGGFKPPRKEGLVGAIDVPSPDVRTSSLGSISGLTGEFVHKLDCQ